MDEKIKEIEKGRRNGYFGEYSVEIEYLLFKIEELEERIQSAEATRDDALAYAKMYKDKAKRLEEGINHIWTIASEMNDINPVQFIRNCQERLE